MAIRYVLLRASQILFKNFKSKSSNMSIFNALNTHIFIKSYYLKPLKSDTAATEDTIFPKGIKIIILS